MKIHEIEIGMSAQRRNVVAREHIVAYAELSGDQNPVHLDDAFAATTQFKGVIAHGMLSAGYISALLGNDLPGSGTVYMGQTLSFRGPVRPGDEVLTVVTVKDVVRDKRRGDPHHRLQGRRQGRARRRGDGDGRGLRG